MYVMDNGAAYCITSDDIESESESESESFIRYNDTIILLKYQSF